MRALTLWQPFASAMERGRKHNETRSWSTEYRGDLVICSAKRRPRREEIRNDALMSQALALPYGFALCVVELYDCRGVEWVVQQPEFTEEEREWGDYTPGIGRYAWLTRNCRSLPDPVPVVGRQGLWTPAAEICALVKEQLPEENGE